MSLVKLDGSMISALPVAGVGAATGAARRRGGRTPAAQWCRARGTTHASCRRSKHFSVKINLALKVNERVYLDYLSRQRAAPMPAGIMDEPAIRIEALSKIYAGRQARAERGQLRRAARADLRAARPQRRGQVDPDQHPRRPGREDRRQGEDLGLRHRRASAQRQALDRRRAAGDHLRSLLHAARDAGDPGGAVRHSRRPSGRATRCSRRCT